MNEQHLLRMSAELQLAANSGDSKTAKVKLVANAGDVVLHWYWGRIVHDFATMSHKARIALDWEHYKPIGYLNKFDLVDGELQCSGAITPFRDDDQASEIVAGLKAGIPFEASIEFSPDFDLEILGEGQIAQVNGRTVEGPASVIRNWRLAAVAVCKLGVDGATSTELLSNKPPQKLSVRGLYTSMSETAHQAEAGDNVAAVEAPEATLSAETVQVVEAAQVEAPVAAADTSDEQPEPALAAEPQPETQLTAADPRAEAKRFLADFGDAGVRMFAEGLSYEDAMKRHLAAQTARIAVLETKLSARAGERGLATPVQLSPGGEDKPKFESLFKVKK